MSEPLLDGKRLAEALNRSVGYVTAMRRAGYRFKYEAFGKTTLEHALAALESCPEFRAKHYQGKGWERAPKIMAQPEAKR